MKQIRLRSLLALVAACAVGTSLWLAYGPWTTFETAPSAAAADRTIRAALDSRQVVIVSVSAAWSVESKNAEQQILASPTIRNAVETGRVVLVRSDVTAPQSNLPVALRTNIKDQRLPAVFVISPASPDEPVVLEGKSVATAEVVRAVAGALKDNR